ncbi:GNAT family N-acetyltransferase [Bifidobacterium oedipodis]|uniref:Acetyltransferase n=1 Tax=Bifidobacterium oedipodis TaxID=2675322 RepID=A0A7Y0HRG1_9BIFI|nr:GNAT family N-acetyltransferase [Bifidobacterium sp. DSM 109957]NMM92866.1 acetyltransferase [Bifidobacterium sp. DSM 109957]
MERMLTIRHATLADLDAIAAVEAACFPAAEAASSDAIRTRLATYPDYFWLLTNGENQGNNEEAACTNTCTNNRSTGHILAFINGFVTDSPDLSDDMYDDASLHNPHGAWQMIFGVDTAPEYQHQGYASMLMRRVIADAQAAGRRGLVLTCKERLIGFYARFGFLDEGVSESTHGNVVWHQMRLTFEPAQRN